MKKNIVFLIVGIYIAVCISIAGNLYINPRITYDYIRITKINQYDEPTDYKHYYDVEIEEKELIKSKYVRSIKQNISYKNFKYSVLYSFVGLVILISIMQLKIKK